MILLPSLSEEPIFAPKILIGQIKLHSRHYPSDFYCNLRNIDVCTKSEKKSGRTNLHFVDYK